MSVCVVCSGGGHLTEALAAVARVREPMYFVTVGAPHVRLRLADHEVFYVVDPHVSPFLYLVNLTQSVRIFLKKKPRVVIATGAGIAIATCLLVKLGGGTMIYVESGARVKSLSRTGRFLYPFADLFLVQWEGICNNYPKAIYGGLLL